MKVARPAALKVTTPFGYDSSLHHRQRPASKADVLQIGKQTLQNTNPAEAESLCGVLRFLVQSNLNLAASAAWSEGHSPPVPGGRVLSPSLFPRSLMFSTLDGRASEKIMSIRS